MTPHRALIEVAEQIMICAEIPRGLYDKLEAAISSAKAAEEGVEEQVTALKVENDRLQTSNAAMRRRLDDIANQYAVDCL